MTKKILKDEMIIVLVTLIWGTGFVVTEYAINANMSPLVLTATRFIIATLTMALFMFKDFKKITQRELKHGIIAGIILTVGFYAQTYGQSLTTVSNSAFITSTNVVIVPFVVWFATKKRPKIKIIFLAFLSFIGVSILTLSSENNFKFNIGDSYMFLCAFAFAVHIVYLGYIVKDNDPKITTFIQISVVAILSTVSMLLFDKTPLNSIDLQVAIPAVLYLGIFSTSLCFILQSRAQRNISPPKIGIIFATEGLFGALFSILLGLEPLTAKIMIGGSLVITSIVLMNINFSKKVKSD